MPAALITSVGQDRQSLTCFTGGGKASPNYRGGPMPAGIRPPAKAG